MGPNESIKRGQIKLTNARTQEYLYQILQKTEFAGKVVLFNGSNNDPKSREIYQRWLERHSGTDQITNSPTADKRAALVDYCCRVCADPG